MDCVTSEIAGYLNNSSMIRKMFEAGLELKKQYGEDNVYDFSLGNPDLPPPEAVHQALMKITAKVEQPFSIGYMPNAGYPEVREKQALQVSREQGVEVKGANVVMTCGAAGGMNVLFRSVLNPGDEVLCPAPYFVEYGFYTGNFGGKLIPVPTNPADFSLDLEAFERAFSSKTRAVIINSPNNPTGRIYTRDEMEALCNLMREMERRYNRTVYLISDEPYRFLNFDGVEIPSYFKLYEHSIIIGSYSKNLSLAGERIGYIAVNPAMKECALLMSGLILSNRILGFVNAPAIAQQILIDAIGSEVDLEIYRARRTAMKEVLDAAGFEYFMPQGAFYFFPKSPVADESKLVDALVKERVLVVPGTGFGGKGFVRLAFCVSEKTISGSKESFILAMRNLEK